MTVEETISWVGQAVEAAGVCVIVVGLVVASARFIRGIGGREPGADGAYRRYRRDIGRAILLGLEFLVAGDIIRTVTATPSFKEVGVLAMIVLIRTFLSVALELETEGRWPWQSRGEADGATPAEP